MPALPPVVDRKLRILHVLRAPVGGLFRHVLDLARAQVARGHAVGLVLDSRTGGSTAARVLADLEPQLALGIRRIPMRRNPHPSDLTALFKVLAAERATRPDVVHGHGSKGALYARAVTALPGHHAPAIRVYTPHGGSLHYAPGTLLHALYMRVERWMSHRSDLILFESAYIAECYRVSVGNPPCQCRVVLNGLGTPEFEPVRPDAGAADFVYVGELRAAKGIDILLEALARAGAATGQRPRLTLVGSGPDRDALGSLAKGLGLNGQIMFAGAMPAREAFALGRVLVMPSRAESLPYVALEAVAAQVPIIATRVGGVPEILGPGRSRLIPANDCTALRDALLDRLATDDVVLYREAASLAAHVGARFRVEAMADGVLAGYRDVMATKAAAGATVLAGTLHLNGSRF